MSAMYETSFAPWRKTGSAGHRDASLIKWKHFIREQYYTAFTDAFMERKYAQVTEAEKAMIESFMNDVRGESYEPVSRLLYYCI